MEDETRIEAVDSGTSKAKTGYKDRDATDARLHKAANATALKKLLFEVTEHNALDSNGDAPLHCFVKRKDREKFNCLITFLIYSKCDVNLLNMDGQSALHLACRENDVHVAKALIAFDAKINAVNIDNKTPLDIVLQHPGNDSDELEILLLLLGAMKYQELSISNGAEGVNGGLIGTATDTAAEMEDDVFTTELVSEHEHLRQPSREAWRELQQAELHSSHNGTNKSPLASPVRHKLTPSLPTLLEDAEVAGQEEKPKKHKLYPLTPDSSTEMGLTNLPIEMPSKHLEEESVSSIASSSSILDKTAFLSDQSSSRSSEPGSTSPLLKEAKEKLAFEGINGKSHSSEAISEPAAGIEETDASPPKDQEQQGRLYRAYTSPVQLRRFRGRAGQHVRFSERSGKEHHHHGEMTTRRQNIFRRQNSGVSLRSVSEYNPEMEVMHSMVGESVVPFSSQQQEGLKILCLDGGGMKGLIQIEMLKMIEQMTGKSISELFDWVVGTSTGGILALGMIYGNLSLDHLRRVYFSMKDTVFKRQSKFISHICNTKALEDLLKGTLGTEKRMSSVKKPNVLIAAVNKSTTLLPLVFFNNCLDNSYSNELVWKVARYTSAAPVFFTECDNYVDGGVKANDPTTFGLAEIQDFLAKKYGRGSSDAKISCVVSLGCGIYPPEPLGNTDIANALSIKSIHKVPSRLKELLTLLTTALSSSEEISRLCHINCEHQGIAYFRFSPEIGEDVGTTEKDNHKLCQIIIRAKQLFKENAEQVESMIQQLGYKIKDNYLCQI